MYATDDLGDAVDATKAFLLPFEFRRWLRIAFVTFFLGGLGLNFSSPSIGTGGGEIPPGPPPEEVWLIVGAVAAVAVVVLLAFAAVRGVMDLVLLESLREEEVALGRFWSARWRQGLRLFGFRLALTLLATALVALPVGLVVVGAAFGGGGALIGLGVLLLIPVVLVVPIGVALVKGFTTAFVAPVMVLENCGVVAGWRRFWSTLAAEWREFAGYAAVNVVLLLAAGAILSLGVVLGAILLAIPFLPVAGIGLAVGAVADPAGTVILAAVAAGYGIALVVVGAFAKAPLIVFLRYYALFVLGDVDDDLDLVPVIRREVRDREE